MKGISLPVNLAVAVIVCVFVMAAIIIFLLLYKPDEDWATLLSNGCLDWVKTNCSYEGYYTVQVKGNLDTYTLVTICTKVTGKYNDIDACRKSCFGC